MESRTRNATRNIISAILYQLLNVIVKFVMRTVFIYVLGKEYLGIGGVFNNILSLLALSELGIGTAIVYDMYKPIANNDYYKVIQLLRFYKKVYFIIGTFIFSVGMILLPFLGYIIKDVPNVSNISLIYILFVINTSSSYFFAQYMSLISAYQKSYLITKNQMVFSVIKTITECCLLILYRSYLIYLLADIIITVIQNYVIYRKACKLFPFMKEETDGLSKVETRKILSNAFANFSKKFSSIVIGATDNILMSVLVNTVVVGYYSNYALIIQIVQSTTVMFMNSIMAGVGNVCVTGTVEQKKCLFRRINFLYMTIYSLLSVGMISIIEPFICLWIGNEYVMLFSIEIVVVLNCFMSGVKQVPEMFISADGLFKHFKILPILAAVLNLILSIVLGKEIGVLGILLGTTISQLLTNTWYDPFIVYKYSIREHFILYILHYIRYIFLACVLSMISIMTGNLIAGERNLFAQIMFRGGIACILFVITWSTLFRKKEEFIYYKKLLIHMMKQKKISN